MKRSLIPKGLEVMAHPIFSKFEVPINLVASVSIPTAVNYEFSDMAELNCPICLAGFEHPVTLICCKQTFCQECINFWMEKKLNCPLCKSKIDNFVKGSDTNILVMEINDSSSSKRMKKESIVAAVDAHKSVIALLEINKSKLIGAESSTVNITQEIENACGIECKVPNENIEENQN